MNEIDDFQIPGVLTDMLDSWATSPVLARKISSEKLDGYNYNPYYEHWEEGDALLKSRIKSGFKTPDQQNTDIAQPYQDDLH